MKKIYVLIVLLAFTGAVMAQTTKVVYGDTVNKTDANGKKQGYWVFNNGSFQEKGSYVDDKKEGTWVIYHPNGMVDKMETFIHGVNNGVSITLDDKGRILYEESLKMGLPHGVTRKFDASTGKKLMEMPYRNGKLHGLKTVYYENGKLQEESYYENGKRDSLATWYDNTGKKIASYTYKNDVFEGPQYTYYDDGTVLLQETFKNNVAVGESKEFYKGGKIKVQGQYVKGNKDGKWIEYDETGKVIKTTIYKDGVEKK